MKETAPAVTAADQVLSILFRTGSVVPGLTVEEQLSEVLREKVGTDRAEKAETEVACRDCWNAWADT